MSNKRFSTLIGLTFSEIRIIDEKNEDVRGDYCAQIHLEGFRRDEPTTYILKYIRDDNSMSFTGMIGDAKMMRENPTVLDAEEGYGEEDEDRCVPYYITLTTNKGVFTFNYSLSNDYGGGTDGIYLVLRKEEIIDRIG
jgi:hypothetical protein